MWRVTSLLAMGLFAGSCFLQGPPPPRPEHSLETLQAAPPMQVSTRDGGRAERAPVRGLRAVADEAVVSVAPPDAGGTYRYNALFEPPRGRILHGMGQWIDGNAEYIAMLADPKLNPASELVFMAVGDWPRPWDSRLAMARVKLAQDKLDGHFPHVNIGLFGIDSSTRREHGIDDEIARTDRYDQRIRELARVLRDLRGPVFVRIGGEFSGEWFDYHAYEYPMAYRKIVKLFREEHVDNVAFIWCYEPSGPDDFDVKDARGWRWFPGDDVIDWYGLDVFEIDEFVVQANTGRRGLTNKAARAERFLAMAREHGKPVIIAECSAARVAITSDAEDGRRDWEEWFMPFLAFLERHPEIEAFHYVNFDWRKSGKAQENGWLEARINLNSYLASKWIEEISRPKYLHAPDIALLNGYAKASEPLPASESNDAPKPAPAVRAPAADTR